jgi:hypothetical protein
MSDNADPAAGRRGVILLNRGILQVERSIGDGYSPVAVPGDNRPQDEQVGIVGADSRPLVSGEFRIIDLGGDNPGFAVGEKSILIMIRGDHVLQGDIPFCVNPSPAGTQDMQSSDRHIRAGGRFQDVGRQRQVHPVDDNDRIIREPRLGFPVDGKLPRNCRKRGQGPDGKVVIRKIEFDGIGSLGRVGLLDRGAQRALAHDQACVANPVAGIVVAAVVVAVDDQHRIPSAFWAAAGYQDEKRHEQERADDFSSNKPASGLKPAPGRWRTITGMDNRRRLGVHDFLSP